jgi:hypothetical protein
MIARTHTRGALVVPMGNSMSDRVGNYVSVTPLQVGNSVNADSQVVWMDEGSRLESGQAAGHEMLARVSTQPIRLPGLDAWALRSDLRSLFRAIDASKPVAVGSLVVPPANDLS